MKKLLSERSSTFSVLTGSQKLGQPVPDSNFVLELNSSAPQAAQVYVPSALVWTYLPVNGRSVPFARRMSYCSGVSSARHSASVFEILVLTFGVYPDWSQPRRPREGPPHRLQGFRGRGGAEGQNRTRDTTTFS